MIKFSYTPKYYYIAVNNDEIKDLDDPTGFIEQKANKRCVYSDPGESLRYAKWPFRIFQLSAINTDKARTRLSVEDDEKWTAPLSTRVYDASWHLEGELDIADIFGSQTKAIIEFFNIVKSLSKETIEQLERASEEYSKGHSLIDIKEINPMIKKVFSQMQEANSDLKIDIDKEDDNPQKGVILDEETLSKKYVLNDLPDFDKDRYTTFTTLKYSPNIPDTILRYLISKTEAKEQYNAMWNAFSQLENVKLIELFPPPESVSYSDDFYDSDENDYERFLDTGYSSMLFNTLEGIFFKDKIDPKLYHEVTEIFYTTIQIDE